VRFTNQYPAAVPALFPPDAIRNYHFHKPKFQLNNFIKKANAKTPVSITPIAGAVHYLSPSDVSTKVLRASGHGLSNSGHPRFCRSVSRRYRLRRGSRNAFHMKQLEVFGNYLAQLPCDSMTEGAG
jgi:hypothetical protein